MTGKKRERPDVKTINFCELNLSRVTSPLRTVVQVEYRTSVGGRTHVLRFVERDPETIKISRLRDLESKGLITRSAAKP